MPAGGRGPRRPPRPLTFDRPTQATSVRTDPAAGPASRRGDRWLTADGMREQFWDPVAGFGVTFRTMFKKVVTEQYPFEKLPTAPRFHGRHQLNRWPDGLEKCIGCELCAWACPADAIYVEGASNTDGPDGERFSPGERYGRVYQINYLRCILCGLCIEACPTRALTMTNEYELADDNRADLIYEKSDLLAPLLPGMEQPPHPMRLGDDEGAYYRGEFARRRQHGRRRRDRVLDPRARSWCSPPSASSFVRKAVHAALLLAVVMISLAVLYAVLEAPFLFAVQIIVYTGAILMLFLFVLMLVGVDASDSVVETIRGQRVLAAARRPAARPGAGGRPRRRSTLGTAVGLEEANEAATSRRWPNILFSRYVFAFEVTSALLITAAVGRDGARPPRAARPRRPTQASARRPAGRATTPRRARTSARCRLPASSPGTTRSTPRPCCPTARRPRRRSPGCSRPRHGPVRAGPRRRRRASQPLGRRVARSTDGDARARPRRTRPRREDRRHDRVRRPLRDPLHDRPRRGAHPAQRDRGVHVRRADAQRLEPRAASPSPRSTATSTARSPPSS